MGGIVSLHAACQDLDPRVRRLAAVCPPLDLAGCQQNVDHVAPSLYRRVLLGDMKAVYRAVAARRRVPLAVEEADRIDTIGAWDGRVVAPRFGFKDLDDYYGQTQLAGRLHNVQIPGLVLHVRHGPLVPLTCRGELATNPPANLEARLLDGGGHIFWRGGPGRSRVMEDTVLDWLLD